MKNTMAAKAVADVGSQTLWKFRLSRIGESRLAPLVDVHVDAPSYSFAGSRPGRLIGC